ncbi:MAG: YafY family protein [Eubacteriales bacterium]|nr:YafY family protein [Eubacteriales bacterium]
MQESRLFKIMYYLLENGRATAPELAEKFEVSVRTIYRDIDALSSGGIPVYAAQGKGGGIFLLENFVLDKTVISKEEQQQIITALQNLSQVSGDTEGLLRKLSALFRQDNPDWIQVDFSRWGKTDTDQRKFQLVKTAILHKKLLEFQYFNSYGKSAYRIVKPGRLHYKSNAWYLQAYCTDKEDYRIFKINRIHNLKLSDQSFEDTLTLPPLEPQQPQAETAYPLIKLRFSQKTAYRVYDEFDPSEIQQTDSGDLTVSVHIPEDAWLYSFLLSFCGHVEVLEPEYIKNRFEQTIKNIYHHYVDSPEKNT